MSARAMMPALVSVALLAAWIGAAALVAAVVAPAAFAVLPSRTLAGAMVGRVLPVVFWSGMIVGITSALLLRAPLRSGIGASLVALVVACAAAQLYVAPRIERVRAAIGGPVEALDPSDPRRQAFGQLHGISVAFMGAGGLAALVALVLLIRLTSSRNTP